VFLPLMPKGVEHSNAARRRLRCWGVFLPLMPKGVEHKIEDDDELDELVADPVS